MNNLTTSTAKSTTTTLAGASNAASSRGPRIPDVYMSPLTDRSGRILDPSSQLPPPPTSPGSKQLCYSYIKVTDGHLAKWAGQVLSELKHTPSEDIQNLPALKEFQRIVREFTETKTAAHEGEKHKLPRRGTEPKLQRSNQRRSQVKKEYFSKQ